MIALLVVAALLVVLVLAVERNHRRHTGPRAPLAGSSDVVDVDLARLRTDLSYGRGTPMFR